MRLLLIEALGSFPDLSQEANQLGFVVERVTNQRKALKALKAFTPDVIVAEFVFTPDFRDRISNLDTLAGQIPLAAPMACLIVLYEPEDTASLARFELQHRVCERLAHPVSKDALLAVLRQKIATVE